MALDSVLGFTTDVPPTSTVPVNTPATIMLPFGSLARDVTSAPSVVIIPPIRLAHLDWPGVPVVALFTVTELAAEVVKFPAASYALQEKVRAPLGIVNVSQAILYGAVVSEPRNVPASQ